MSSGDIACSIWASKNTSRDHSRDQEKLISRWLANTREWNLTPLLQDTSHRCVNPGVADRHLVFGCRRRHSLCAQCQSRWHKRQVNPSPDPRRAPSSSDSPGGNLLPGSASLLTCSRCLVATRSQILFRTFLFQLGPRPWGKESLSKLSHKTVVDSTLTQISGTEK